MITEQCNFLSRVAKGLLALDKINNYFGKSDFYIEFSTLHFESEDSERKYSAEEVSKLLDIELDCVKEAFVVDVFLNNRLDVIMGSDKYLNASKIIFHKNGVTLINSDSSKEDFSSEIIAKAMKDSDDSNIWTYEELVKAEEFN